MKKPPFIRVAIASSLLLAPTALRAELPMLTEKPWLGYFLGLNDKKFRFGIEAKDGAGVIDPLKRNGEPVSSRNKVTVGFEVLETMPDGKIVIKQVKEDTLASTQPAAEDPKGPVTVTGKTTGDAAFEYTVTPQRGGLSVSGKITDKGTLTNPLTFAVSLGFSPYNAPSGNGDDALEKFEKKIRRDEIRLGLDTGKREKIDFVSKTNPATVAKDGFTSADIRTEGYDGVGFGLTASENSKITFVDKGETPLWKNFTLRWSVNEGADPTKERFTIEGK